MGSAAEVDTQIEIAHQLGYINPEEYTRTNDQVDHILRMLNKLSYVISHFKRNDQTT